MAGHVPGVGDPWRRLRIHLRAGERLFRLVTVPQVDPVVVRSRVHRLLPQHFLDELIDGDATGGVPDHLPCKKCLRLDVLRMGQRDGFQTLDVILPALLVISPFPVISSQGVQVFLLPIGQPLPPRFRHRQKGRRPRPVVPVGQGHPPVGHRALRIDLRGFAEGPLGLVIVIRVQLRHALVEERLRLRVRRGNGKADLPHPGHRPRALPGRLIERLPVQRAVGGRTRTGRMPLTIGIRRCRRCGDRGTAEDRQQQQGKSVSHSVLPTEGDVSGSPHANDLWRTTSSRRPDGCEGLALRVATASAKLLCERRGGRCLHSDMSARPFCLGGEI